MRNAIIAAMLTLAACSGGVDAIDGNAAAPVGEAAPPPAPVAVSTPEPPRYPLPTGLPSGMLNPQARPEVAAHIARQERCAHWREEQQGGAVRPEVSEGMARDCRGIDAELDSLRSRLDGDGPSINLLRPFTKVER